MSAGSSPDLRRENQDLRRRLAELWRAHRDLVRRAERDREAARMAAVEQTVVTMQHAINNSLAGMAVALRLVTQDAERLGNEARAALAVVQQELTAITGVMTQLRQLRHATAVPYLAEVQMIDLPRSSGEELETVPCGSGRRAP